MKICVMSFLMHSPWRNTIPRLRLDTSAAGSGTLAPLAPRTPSSSHPIVTSNPELRSFLQHMVYLIQSAFHFHQSSTFFNLKIKYVVTRKVKECSEVITRERKKYTPSLTYYNNNNLLNCVL